MVNSESEAAVTVEQFWIMDNTRVDQLRNLIFRACTLNEGMIYVVSSAGNRVGALVVPFWAIWAIRTTWVDLKGAKMSWRIFEKICITNEVRSMQKYRIIRGGYL